MQAPAVIVPAGGAPPFKTLSTLPCLRSGTLLLVSKRWQRVLVEESAAFACFVLRPCPERLGGQAATPAQQGAWLEGQRSFLQRVAPRVHEVTVHKGAIIQRQANKAAKQCQLHRQLSLLQPGSLAGLVLDYAGSCSEPLLAALARAGGGSLTRLEINSTRLPASAARVLRGLSTLRALDLGCYHPEDELFQAILTLTSLTRLVLHPIGAFSDQVSSLLATLSTLRQLSISEFAQPPPYPEPQVRQLLQRASRLEALSYARTHMSRDRVGFEVCAGVRVPAGGCSVCAGPLRVWSSPAAASGFKPCCVLLRSPPGCRILVPPALCRWGAPCWTSLPTGSAVAAAAAFQSSWVPCTCPRCTRPWMRCCRLAGSCGR